MRASAELEPNWGLGGQRQVLGLVILGSEGGLESQLWYFPSPPQRPPRSWCLGLRRLESRVLSPSWVVGDGRHSSLLWGGGGSKSLEAGLRRARSPGARSHTQLPGQPPEQGFPILGHTVPFSVWMVLGEGELQTEQGSGCSRLRCAMNRRRGG